MKTTNHHARTAPRIAAIAIGIALFASCGSTEGTTTDAVAAADSAGYTIVAGDTLSGIADRAEVSVADIVTANGWSDGSDHLILPGDVIKLPQGTSAAPANPAVPAATTKSADTGSAPASQSGDPSAPVAATASVCAGGEFGDDAEILEGETLAAVAARVGRTEDELQRTNQFGTNGRPAFGSSDSLAVPCVANWPQNTTFYELIDPATCGEIEYYSLRGLYRVQSNQDATAIAEQIGVTLDRLQAVNNIDLGAIQPGDQVGVCQRWF